MNRLIGRVNRRKPTLEFGNPGLGDDDPFGCFDAQTQRQPAAEPDRDLGDGLPRDDELAVGTEEIARRQQRLQRFERLVERILLTVERTGRHPLVARVTIGDPLALQRNELVAHAHQENLLSLVGTLRQPFDPLAVTAAFQSLIGLSR